MKKTTSKKKMIEYLANHFMYNTMNSWNNCESYARNVKVHSIDTTSEVRDKLYELLDTEGAYNDINDILRDFDERHEHAYQMGFNGRSGGYIVLYGGGIKESEHKSYCTECGQRNFTTIEDTGNECGKCGEKARVNHKFVETYTKPGQGMSNDIEELKELEDFELQDLYELVEDFDATVDLVIKTAIDMATRYEVVEKEISIPKTIKVLQEKGA